jgi:uncharacterized protein YndB with AHSA1/START domain
MATNISRILINASNEQVWDVLTKPELVKTWQYGSDLITDWAVGSDIRFRTEWQGKIFEQWGKVLEFKSFSLIRYSLFAPSPGRVDTAENYFGMTYILTPENGMIKLDIIREDNRTGAIQEDPQGEENPLLQSLKRLAESIN